MKNLKPYLFFHPGLEDEACQVSEYQGRRHAYSAGLETAHEDADKAVFVHCLLHAFPERITKIGRASCRERVLAGV